MKKKKLFSLLMAGMLSVATLTQVETIVHAQDNQQMDNSVRKELEKGDTFSGWVKIAEENIPFVKYIDVRGSAVKDSFIAKEVQINGDGWILIDKLTYSGQGNSVEVEIEFDNDIPSMQTTIPLLHANPLESAGEALVATDSIINVVTGERQQITFTLENTGDAISEAGEMTFEVADKKLSEGIEIKTNEVSIPELRKGESRDFSFVADIGLEVVHGIHEINVIITDKDGGNEQVKTLELKVDSDFMPPSLQIAANNTTQFQINEPKSIGIELKNVGHVAAKNVKVELTPNDQVIVADGGNVRYINTIDSGKTQTLDVMLQVVDSNAVTVPLQMNLTYIDDLGETHTDAQTLYINTETSAFKKELTITDIVESTAIYEVGQTFGIGFSLFAEDGAENVTVSVSGADGIVPKSKNLFVERTITPGTTKDYQVEFVASENIATGTHLVKIEAKYKLNNEEVVMEQYATVSIDNPEKEEEDEEAGGRPIVMVNQYNVVPNIVKAGENFNLKLDFINRHPNHTAKNIKATLTISEQGEDNTGTVFTPVNASNTFFIGSLGPEQINTQSITLYTLPNASPKTYEITVDMVYEDINGETYTDSQMISVPVEQVTKLEVGDVQIEVVEVGMEAYMTARLYNTGKTTISNVKISTQGENFDVIDNIHFIGTMEKGASEVYEPVLIPYQSGMLTGQILIEYEDVTGTVQTMTQDFEMEAMEAWVPEPMPEMNHGNGPIGMDNPAIVEEESNTALYVGMGVGVVIAVIITAITLKKRRHKKEQAFLDED